MNPKEAQGVRDVIRLFRNVGKGYRRQTSESTLGAWLLIEAHQYPIFRAIVATPEPKR